MNTFDATKHPTEHGQTSASDIYRATVLAPLFAAAKTHARHYTRIDQAYASMLVEQGILSGDAGKSLLDGLARIEETLQLGQQADAGPYEDLFYLREAALKDVIGSDLAGRLHTGRSRNDIEATVFRLQLKEAILQTMEFLGRLVETLLALAEVERATPIVAYTHGQPAQPTTFGHYLLGFTEVLLRDLKRLSHAVHDVDACPLGAAAITTTGFPINRERLADLLGFAQVQENSYGCIAAADQFAAAQAALQLMFINIGRVVQDMAFWTSFEVGQARAGDGFVQISSIMPQKRNPLAIEHLRVMASLGAGNCQAAIQALHNTPFADMVDAEGPTQSVGLASFDRAARVLPLLESFLSDLKIDVARAIHNADQSCATMTELADSLVRLEGVAFRTAHDIASSLASSLVAAGRGISGLTGEEVSAAFEQAVGRKPGLSAQALKALAQVDHFIAVRDRTGGPGPNAMASSLRRQTQQLRDLREAGRHLRMQDADAAKRLHATRAKLTGA